MVLVVDRVVVLGLLVQLSLVVALEHQIKVLQEQQMESQPARFLAVEQEVLVAVVALVLPVEEELEELV
jgi:hypothetical protein